MAKKKKEQEIAVKRPKVGETYRFRFAGSPMVGILDEKNEKLTEHYKEPWFWFKVPASEDSLAKRDMRYPVSIYNIVGVIKSEE